MTQNSVIPTGPSVRGCEGLFLSRIENRSLDCAALRAAQLGIRESGQRMPCRQRRIEEGASTSRDAADFRSGIGETACVAFPLLYPPPKTGEDFRGASVEQIRQALLHLVGDVERHGLDGRGRVNAAARHEDAAVDDEQIFYIVAATPVIHHPSARDRSMRAVPRRWPGALSAVREQNSCLAPAAVRISSARAMPCSIMWRVLSLIA